MANSVTFPVGLGGSGITIDDSSNPGVGLGNGGHKTLFVPALSQTVVMAQTAVTNATNAQTYMGTTNGYMATTLTYKDAALASSTLAQNWATQLVTPVAGGEYSAKYWAQQSAASAAASAMVTFTDNFAVVKGTADNTKFLKFNVSGFPTGTTYTVTPPNKSGTMAMLDDGGLVPVAEIILGSAAANIDFLNVFTSAYDRYLITFENVVASGASQLHMRYATTGTVDTGTVYVGAPFFQQSTSSTTSIYIGDVASGVSTPCCGEITVYDTNSTTAHKRGQSICLNSGDKGYMYHNTYTRNSAPAAMSGFRLFILSGATFSAGAKVRVYGYKKA